MDKLILIILILMFNFSILKQEVKNCGEEKIENCKVCGQGNESNSCAVCEDEHFPLLENLLCLPCNDSLYGQVGCKGECDSSDYTNSGFAYCQECKEGFYNLEGICHSCNEGSPGCKECTYVKEKNDTVKKFKC